MKKVLKALTIAAAFTFVQGVYVSNPTDASAMLISNFIKPVWDIGIIPSAQFIYTTAYTNPVLVSGFSLPTDLNTFQAAGLQVSGNSFLRGTIDVATFLSLGTVNFTDHTVITGNAGAASSSMGHPEWFWAGGTVTPAPRPRKDADFATMIEGQLDLASLQLSWDANGVDSTVNRVGLVAAKGGMFGDLLAGSVTNGWSLRKTTTTEFAALQLRSRNANILSSGTDLGDNIDIIVAERNTPVPEPSTVLLLGGGLAGLALTGLRRRRNAAEK